MKEPEFQTFEMLVRNESDLDLAREVSQEFGIDFVGGVVYSKMDKKLWDISTGLRTESITSEEPGFLRNPIFAMIPYEKLENNSSPVETTLDSCEDISIRTSHLWPERSTIKWLREIADIYGIKLDLDVSIEGSTANLDYNVEGNNIAAEFIKKYLDLYRKFGHPLDFRLMGGDIRKAYMKLDQEISDEVPDENGIDELLKLVDKGMDEYFFIEKFE